MLELGPLVFASPWLLVALASLPVLWWLLRVTPPSPRLLAFPPTRLLLALKPQEETPARTPLWLILLRMLIAALIIFAVAQPLLNPGAALRGSGPLILVIDDGWGAAIDWPRRMLAIDGLIDRAEREERPVRILTTARGDADKAPTISDPMTAAEARRVARAIAPKPWIVDRRGAAKALSAVEVGGSAHAAWISDGIGDGQVPALAAALQRLGGVWVYAQPVDGTAFLIGEPQVEGDRLIVPIARAGGGQSANHWLRATAEDGRVIARRPVAFEAAATEAKVTLELPGELRNVVTRLQVEAQPTAGATFLLDERWRRRPVGLVSGDVAEAAQPLLSSLYYMERALKPFAEVRRGAIESLLERELAVLVLADIGKMTDAQGDRVRAWLEKGGVVLRFAGPKLAKTTDELIPVRLRGGGRALGGTMSWSEPARLKPFEEGSPFAGLAAPPDIRIRRQVLAEPSLDLNDKTWARLSDGTPLITAEKRGQGWLILVHTTANSDWSNLPVSGLFVNMLRRIVSLSQGVINEDATGVLAAVETLDGFGNLGSPPATATPIPGAEFRKAGAGPKTPPGYYGREGARRALNLGAGDIALAPLNDLPPGIARTGYDSAASVEFGPWLLLAALVLALIDLFISYVLRGLFVWRNPNSNLRGPNPQGPDPRGAAASVAVMAVITAMVLLGMPASAEAQGFRLRPAAPPKTYTGPDAKTLAATLETRLAYVITGDGSLDSVSRAGLRGLGRILRRRTAVEPGEPVGVNVEKDEIAFYPLLFWSVSSSQPRLPDLAIAKLNTYLRNGGTILFDTRERSDMLGGGSTGQRLRFLLNRLDIPTLIHVPKDHVLTKAFYLLKNFPGRWTGGPVWVERRGGRHNDGVSSVVIGSNDWAGAWAINEFGSPMFPVVPGSNRQREMAYRFGVNWVMYALTGNYKTDQVHVPAIIERLGQ